MRGSVSVHRVGAQPESRDTVGVPRLGDDPRWEARRRVNDCRAGDDQADPAPRSLLLERDLARRHLAHVDQTRAHRRLHDAVLELDARDRTRREEEGIRVHNAVWPPSGVKSAPV